MAIKLKRHGIKKVRPLHGGLKMWEELNFPTHRSDDLLTDDENNKR